MSIPFEIPANYASQYASGALIRFGSLLKDSASGRIVAHLVESGTAQQLLSSLPNSLALGFVSPPLMIVDTLEKLTSLGLSIYNSRQIAVIKETLEQLQVFQVATLGMSLVNIGITAAGFVYMNQRLKELHSDINKSIKQAVDDILYAQMMRALKEHFSQIDGLVQNAGQVIELRNPEEGYKNIADKLSSHSAHFKGEIIEYIKHGSVSQSLFWKLVQYYSLSNSIRIDCLVRADELKYAIKVSEDIGQDYQNIFSHLSPITFNLTESLSTQKVLTTIRDITDAALTKPYLIETLLARKIHGDQFMLEIANESKRPLLMLTAT